MAGETMGGGDICISFFVLVCMFCFVEFEHGHAMLYYFSFVLHFFSSLFLEFGLGFVCWACGPLALFCFFVFCCLVLVLFIGRGNGNEGSGQRKLKLLLINEGESTYLHAMHFILKYLSLICGSMCLLFKLLCI